MRPYLVVELKRLLLINDALRFWSMEPRWKLKL